MLYKKYAAKIYFKIKQELYYLTVGKLKALDTIGYCQRPVFSWFISWCIFNI